MKYIKSSTIDFIPASHEDPRDPGVFKKVLVSTEESLQGEIKMINWASIPPGKQFKAHAHKDMHEVFIFLDDAEHAEFTCDKKRVNPSKGDCIIVSPGEVHTMKNNGPIALHFISAGIAPVD